VAALEVVSLEDLKAHAILGWDGEDAAAPA
jgi:hypothetical protein